MKLFKSAEIMLSRKVEDYMEAILNIADQKGYARTKDIASVLNITSPSVVEMIKKLDKMEFINYRKYEGVTLTHRGREIAASVRERHEIIKSFLKIIHIPNDIANKDACTMEHHLDPETIKQIKKLVSFVKDAPDNPKWLEHFEIYCKTGKYECKKEED
jgi:DtxR family Mn-dependent transcriptional regulator